MFYSPSTGGFYDESIHGARRINVDGEDVDNPACSIPVDAIPSSQWSYTHAELMAGQSAGSIISADENGRPILVNPAAIQSDPIEQLKAEILNLEATVTDRRLREAVLGLDGGWLSDINNQCSTLRAQINDLMSS